MGWCSGNSISWTGRIYALLPSAEFNIFDAQGASCGPAALCWCCASCLGAS